MTVQELIAKTNVELCDFIEELYKVTDQQYAKLREDGNVRIDGKAVKLTKEELIARVYREQSSQLVIQSTGHFPEAKKKLASLAQAFAESYEYDALSILVHGEEIGFIDFNGIPVARETAIPELRAIGKTCKAKFVIVSCYNNPGGKIEKYGVVPARGKVGYTHVYQEKTKTWEPDKSRPCWIDFKTYRLKKGYSGENDKEVKWLGWEDTYEKYPE